MKDRRAAYLGLVNGTPSYRDALLTRAAEQRRLAAMNNIAESFRERCLALARTYESEADRAAQAALYLSNGSNGNT